MIEGPGPRVPVSLWLFGFVLPVVLTVALVGLSLDYVPSLVAAAAAFFAAGAYAGRLAGPGAVAAVVPLVSPTLAFYALFALNAQRWQLLGVPAVGALASLAGVLLVRRLRRG